MATGLINAPRIPTYAPGRRDMSVRHDQILDPSLRRMNLQTNGLYRVVGTTAVAGSPDVPVARMVVLLDEKTKRPARSMMSSISGAYNFDHVARGPWSVISWDHTGEYNAVIASNKLGDPM